ncbi:conserved hypothetical protein [Vibrio crassostreae]|uniref:Uncharacterized protein n=1 Tax=Vibrio crassostreae TaxID=246167 RepID=A0ABP1X0X8_9VIBR|nr:conserved hypothetical protein [Vibrio crassostreae]CDT79460.1 hypothetical protein VCR3J2_230013 [Vibrio coralliirubri]CAK2053784.1 conserved hypothetical protein [Vibrio crassostreae]CAK2075460.1 conserved hypothetical protein [Vibrio crassostreae]CAK2076759.1 conserved hypothetical protein [Vibrio crassostreae]
MNWNCDLSFVYPDISLLDESCLGLELDLDCEDNVNKIRSVSAPDKIRTIEKLKGSIV